MADRSNLILRSLRSLEGEPIEDLLRTISVFLKANGEPEISDEELVNLISLDVNSPQRIALHKLFARWEVAPDPKLSAPLGSRARREEVLETLRLSKFAKEIESAFPIIESQTYLISSEQRWEKWYSPSIGNGFYWDKYRGVLEKKGVDQHAIESISGSIDDILQRIANPEALFPYQSKGLVVGYVQSGKTSHFTGLIAKAVSAGYKLIIVLTGTIELLRSQTQRRLDMELVGKTNILQGRKESDIELVADVDYVLTDRDWGKFVEHTEAEGYNSQVPRIRRLTTFSEDYKSLQQGLDALDFEKDKRFKDKPLFDHSNLEHVDVRLMVLKKNDKSLKKVIKDLRAITGNLAEVPAIIIDDEADQASVNTKAYQHLTRQLESGENTDTRVRTVINGLISELLNLLPRSQYIGYTATPFANVFIEPDDSEDIFPKDFIVSLPVSREYVGARQFHDIAKDLEFDRTDPSVSNEAAFVRGLFAGEADSELLEMRQAIDMFVLTGAVKAFRQDLGLDGDFRHHTMLAHTSPFKNDHRNLKQLVEEAWDLGDYGSPASVERLHTLLINDIKRVNKSRDWSFPLPEKSTQLENCLGDALNLMTSLGPTPVVVVNSDQDLATEKLNFEQRREWRIVAGGSKLSRGFTIEGLTVSYFRRKANTQDALMQMGRWFGYRPGYRDLVRLFIARSITGTGNRQIDLYEAFTSVVEDEEEFRQKLAKYSALSTDDGRPVVSPSEIPPLVYQQLPWLKPTSRNKMFNARLSIEAESEKFLEKTRHRPYDPKVNSDNFALFSNFILPSLTRLGEFKTDEDSRIRAKFGILSAESIIDFLSGFAYSGQALLPTVNFIKKSHDDGTLQDFFVMLHLPGETVPFRKFTEEGESLPLIRRKRRPDKNGFVGSDPKHRAPLHYVSGPKPNYRDAQAEEIKSTNRASMLVSLVQDPPMTNEELGSRMEIWSTEKVAVVFGFVFPFESAPYNPKLAFEAARPDRGPIVEQAP